MSKFKLLNRKSHWLKYLLKPSSLPPSFPVFSPSFPESKTHEESVYICICLSLSSLPTSEGAISACLCLDLYLCIYLCMCVCINVSV